MHREGLPEPDNQHGRVLLVHGLVLEVDIVDQLDGLGVVDGGPAHSDPQLELPGHLDGEEEPGYDPEEEVEDGADHEHQHGTVQGTLNRTIRIRDVVKNTLQTTAPRLWRTKYCFLAVFGDGFGVLRSIIHLRLQTGSQENLTAKSRHF